jgi:hypothetical protein
MFWTIGASKKLMRGRCKGKHIAALVRQYDCFSGRCDEVLITAVAAYFVGKRKWSDEKVLAKVRNW